MFTGIVEELGEVVGAETWAASARITVRGPMVTDGADHGDSIAVNGICLTVVDRPDAGHLHRRRHAGDALRGPRSRPRARELGSTWNARSPPTAASAAISSRGTSTASATVVERVPGDNWELVRIAIPADLARYVVEKGSIAVDGVSLTVAGVDDDAEPDGATIVTVSLIPETLTRTTLGLRRPGEPVNLEVDVLAKYVERMLARREVPA